AISGITIDTANPKKFTVHFTRSFCPALLQVFGSAPIPSHVFGKYTVDNDPTKNIDTAPENAAPAAVSGPFKFKEWRKGDQVILSRNDGYWRGAPYLDEFVQKVVLGHGEKQLYNTPSVSWAYPGTAGYNDYKFDAGKAEQLIKDAGYTKGSDGFYAKDGKTLGWTIVTNQGNKTSET